MKQETGGEQNAHTAEADYLPSQFTGGQQKKKKQKQPREIQMSCKWLVRGKWQSLCFYLFTPSRKAGEGVRAVFSFNVGTD